MSFNISYGCCTTQCEKVIKRLAYYSVTVESEIKVSDLISPNEIGMCCKEICPLVKNTE